MEHMRTYHKILAHTSKNPGGIPCGNQKHVYSSKICWESWHAILYIICYRFFATSYHSGPTKIKKPDLALWAVYMNYLTHCNTSKPSPSFATFSVLTWRKGQTQESNTPLNYTSLQDVTSVYGRQDCSGVWVLGQNNITRKKRQNKWWENGLDEFTSDHDFGNLFQYVIIWCL